MSLNDNSNKNKPGRPKHVYTLEEPSDEHIFGVYNNAVESRFFPCENCGSLNEVNLVVRKINERLTHKAMIVDPKIWNVFKVICVTTNKSMNTVFGDMVGYYQKHEKDKLKNRVDDSVGMMSGIEEPTPEPESEKKEKKGVK